MRIGVVDILLNNPLLWVGSTDPVDDFVEIPVAVDPARQEVGKHLAIRSRVQVAPVEVSLWDGIFPDYLETVYNGRLQLDDGFLAIFDIENSSRFLRRVGGGGVYDISVSVDDVRSASRVFVAINSGVERFKVDRVPEYPLPNYRGPDRGITQDASVLQAILSGHDRPLARLVNAISLISANSREESGEFNSVTYSRIRGVVEWLRWLSPTFSLAYCQRLGEIIQRRLEIDQGSGSDESVITTALEIWAIISNDLMD